MAKHLYLMSAVHKVIVTSLTMNDGDGGFVLIQV